MASPSVDQDITMELLTDIATVMRSVSKDLLPLVPFTVAVHAKPPSVVLRVPGATNKPIQAILKELAEACVAVTDKALPSLPLRYTIIGGTEASGIEVTLKPGAGQPVYGHIIRAKVDRLIASNALREKPRLLDKLLKGGRP